MLADARSALGVDAAGTDNSTDVTLAAVTSNYLSISGQEITAGTVFLWRWAEQGQQQHL